MQLERIISQYNSSNFT